MFASVLKERYDHRRSFLQSCRKITQRLGYERHSRHAVGTEPAKILDIARDCGFGDISNFNRTFRAEFGVNPRALSETDGSPRLLCPHHSINRIVVRTLC
ncbi:MAG TPA: AraC family transcriptional regulator [Bryobacteraceae bacterium]|nr:AraC family transcriptional regulator [Bryobacteraceae bacterium]